MGCSASSDALTQLRASLNKVNMENENLAEAINSDHAFLAESLNAMQEERDNAYESTCILTSLQPTEEEVLNTEINLANMREFLSWKLDQSHLQTKLLRKIQNTVKKYKEIVETNTGTSPSTIEEVIEEYAKSRIKNFAKVSLKHICQSLKPVLLEKYRTAFRLWRYAPKTPIKLLRRSYSLKQNVRKSLDDENPILSILRSYNLLSQKPAGPLVMYRFLEEVLDKKYENDLKEINEGRRPKEMIDFLLDHVQLTFGIGALALKSLAQIIPTMHLLYEEKNEYAIWFCRLFSLFHPSPFPYSLCVYLTKARIEFLGMNQKYDKHQIGQGNKPSGYRSKSKGKEALEPAEKGGIAFAADVIDYISYKFASDRELGVRLIEMMVPVGLTAKQYAVFRILLKIKRLRITPEVLFGSIDREDDGSVSNIDLIARVKALDVWISEHKLHEMCELFDNGDRIHKQSFLSKFQMNTHFVISKCQFLTSLTEVFMERYLEEVQRNQELFASGNSIVDFERVVKQFCPSISVEEIDEIYEETGGSSVEPAAIAKVLIKYAISCPSLSVFDIPSFLNQSIHNQ